VRKSYITRLKQENSSDITFAAHRLNVSMSLSVSTDSRP